jgi:hypothetical protein
LIGKTADVMPVDHAKNCDPANAVQFPDSSAVLGLPHTRFYIHGGRKMAAQW